MFCLIFAYIWRLRFTWRWGWLLLLALMVGSHWYRGETRRASACAGWDSRAASRPSRLSCCFVTLWLVAGGLVFRTVRDVTWEGIVFGLVAYSLWGFFQQYLLNGYFVNRFLEGRPRQAAQQVPLLAAVLFSAAHLPNWFLMAVTFGGGYLSARAYLQTRNLLFLGLAHGIIGFLLYLVVPDAVSHHLAVGPGWFVHR